MLIFQLLVSYCAVKFWRSSSDSINTASGSSWWHRASSRCSATVCILDLVFSFFFFHHNKISKFDAPLIGRLGQKYLEKLQFIPRLPTQAEEMYPDINTRAMQSCYTGTQRDLRQSQHSFVSHLYKPSYFTAAVFAVRVCVCAGGFG